MAESQVISRELSKMGDIHQLIASKLPNLDPGDPQSVSELQTVLNLVYGDVAVDGEFGPSTSTYLRNWLSKTDYISSLGETANNTILGTDLSDSISNAPNFRNNGIAAMVNDSAKMALGTDKVIDKVVNELSIDKLRGDNENA